MKIVHIITEKDEPMTEKEQQEYFENNPKSLFLPRKTIKLEKPIYIVEMTDDELQLVSFYLELERRKPIINVKLDAKLGKEK